MYAAIGSQEVSSRVRTTVPFALSVHSSLGDGITMDADEAFLRFVPLRFYSAEIMDHFPLCSSAKIFMCREKFVIV
jgi:hypothetical protein